MRKTKEILRLRLGLGRSLRETGLSCGVGATTVHDVLARALPDFAAVYRELKRRGVTLELLWQEYRQGHPEDGYGYSRFCDLYRQWRGQLDLLLQRHAASPRGGPKMGHGPGGPPVLDSEMFMQLLRRLRDVGCLSAETLRAVAA